MTDGGGKPRRYPYLMAADMAVEIVAKLAPYCLVEPMYEGDNPEPMILVVGSIRRQVPAVHDIDIVTAPKRPRDLFGGVDATKADYLSLFLERKGVIMERDGPNLKTFKYGQFNVDIYQVFNLDQWGWTVAMRTGSADFNQLLLTPAELGGLNHTGITSRQGWLYQPATLERIPTRFEKDVFDAFGIDWIDPLDRDPALIPL